jgi:hypothetical protein
MKKAMTLGAIVLAAAAIGGCSPRQERMATGAGVGAAAGAVIGGLASGTSTGVLTGAAIGGAGGALIADATRPRPRCWRDVYGRRVCARR